MDSVSTMPITTLRDTIYDRSATSAITAVTRRGRFVGVFISAGEEPEAIRRQLGRSIHHNPAHTVGVLTRRILR